MRIDIDMEERERKRVKQYANKRGLKMSRAYWELIKGGLESDGIIQK